MATGLLCIGSTNNQMECTVLNVLIWPKIEEFIASPAAKPR